MVDLQNLNCEIKLTYWKTHILESYEQLVKAFKNKRFLLKSIKIRNQTPLRKLFLCKKN